MSALFPTYPVIRLDVADLKCVRGGRTVFCGLDMNLTGGMLAAAVGPNGSGKSSLLRLLAGLITPAAGTVRLAPDAGGQGLCHYFGHLDGLKNPLGVADNLRFWQRLYGGAGPVSIAEACAATGVGHLTELPVAVLSAGQRRRVGLARLLINPRPLWFLDEPSSALDADGTALLGRLMRGHLDAGGAIVAATHLDLPVAADLTLTLAGAGATDHAAGPGMTGASTARTAAAGRGRP